MPIVQTVKTAVETRNAGKRSTKKHRIKKQGERGLIRTANGKGA